MLTILCSNFVQKLAKRCNQSLPLDGDLLVYNGTKLKPSDLDKILTKAAERRIPLLIHNFASISGPMGTMPLTSTVLGYLEYQKKHAQKTTCQIQGERIIEEQRNFWEVLEHFRLPSNLRNGVWNLLDNLLKYDL